MGYVLARTRLDELNSPINKLTRLNLSVSQQRIIDFMEKLAPSLWVTAPTFEFTLKPPFIAYEHHHSDENAIDFGSPNKQEVMRAFLCAAKTWNGGVSIGLHSPHVHLADGGVKAVFIETGTAAEAMRGKGLVYQGDRMFPYWFAKVQAAYGYYETDPDCSTNESLFDQLIHFLKHGPPPWVKVAAAGAAGFYFRNELRTVAKFGLSFLPKGSKRRS